MTRPCLVPPGLALAALVAVAAPAAAQVAAAPRVEVSVTAGAFRPLQQAVAAVYPDTTAAVTVVADLQVTPMFSVFGGGRFSSTDGRPVALDTGSASTFDTTLATRSFLAGGRVHHRVGRLRVFAGGGVVYAWYKESWRDAEESVSGGAWGAVVQAGARYPVYRRLSLVGRFDWTTIATRRGSAREPAVNLGGVEMSGGVAIGF